jgi:hypothetical protein
MRQYESYLDCRYALKCVPRLVVVGSHIFIRPQQGFESFLTYDLPLSRRFISPMLLSIGFGR